MFKHAYVRGIQTALVNSGHAAFPDETTANKVADYIADHVGIDPFQGVPAEATAKIAADVIEASEWIKQQPGFKAAGWNKLASWDDVYALADHNAVQLMTKAAEGSTIEGGDKGNTQAEAPAGETKMDARQRPPGYAEDSRGESAVDTRPGAVGKEEENPNRPAATDSKDNSVQEQSRTASLAYLFRKAAEGSTIMGGDKGNMDMSTAEAKMDASQRPQGYAVLPGQGDLGEMMDHYSGAAIVGREAPHPNGPSQSPSGSNSLTETSAKAASADPFIALFKKTAAEVHEYLPRGMNEDAKIAAVRACMGMNNEEKAHYLVSLQKEAAVSSKRAAVDTRHNPERTAETARYKGYPKAGTKNVKESAEDDKELPDFIKKKMKDADKEEHEDGEHEMSESAEEEKEEHEDKKEASLRAQLRRIQAAKRR